MDIYGGLVEYIRSSAVIEWYDGYVDRGFQASIFVVFDLDIYQCELI